MKLDSNSILIQAHISLTYKTENEIINNIYCIHKFSSLCELLCDNIKVNSLCKHVNVFKCVVHLNF